MSVPHTRKKKPDRVSQPIAEVNYARGSTPLPSEHQLAFSQRRRDKNRAHSRLRRGASAVDTERYFVLVFPGRPFTTWHYYVFLVQVISPDAASAYRVTMGHQEIVDLPLQHARRDFHASSTFFSLSFSYFRFFFPFFLSVFSFSFFSFFFSFYVHLLHGLVQSIVFTF